MNVPAPTRIVLLGKTGVGKSSLANTIFGEATFQINRLNGLKAHGTEAQTKSVDGRSITLIDTPGFFDAGRSEEEMKPEIVRCTTECAPGPHAFIIVLKVEKYTKQEQAVITKICDFFSEDALKYAVVVFTHGDQLPEGMKIKEYADQNKGLSDLMKKCGGRCHIVDNRYWKSVEDDEYRSNQFQVAELLATIDKIVKDNSGGYYTNEVLQKLEQEIRKEEQRISQSAGNLPEEEVRQQAKDKVFEMTVRDPPRTWIRALVGFTGLAILAGILAVVVINTKFWKGITEEKIAEAVPEVFPLPERLEEVVKDVVPPIVEIPQTVEDVVDKYLQISERFPDPWNNFE